MKTTIMTDERLLSNIKKLHEDKVEINRVKLEHFKKYDTDDHGFIWDPDFHVDIEPNTDDGCVRGPVAIGKAIK